MPRRDRTLTARAWCLALLAAPGWSLASAFVPEDLAAVRELLPSLESADYGVREAASKRLREDPRLALDAIGVAMADPGIGPEQAQRLVTAFKARFALSPRPALGIGLDLPEGEDRGIIVVELNRGLPAIDAGLLEWGDIIVALDGAKTVVSDPALPAGMRQQLALNRTISLIQSYQPGESVLLEILRLKDREAVLRGPAPEPRQPGEGAGAEEPAPQGVQRELGRMDAALLKRSMPRERIEVRVPLGYYADLRNRGMVGGGFGAGGGPAPDFSFLIQSYGEAAMEARLNRLGVKWPGGTPFDAVSKIAEGHAAPPPVFTGRSALALDGAGHDPALAQGVGAFAPREGLVFQGIDREGRQLFRAGNGVIAVQQGVQVRLLPQGPQRGAVRGGEPAMGGGQAVARDRKSVV